MSYAAVGSSTVRSSPISYGRFPRPGGGSIRWNRRETVHRFIPDPSRMRGRTRSLGPSVKDAGLLRLVEQKPEVRLGEDLIEERRRTDDRRRYFLLAARAS